MPPPDTLSLPALLGCLLQIGLFPLLPADVLATWPQALRERLPRLGWGLPCGDGQLHCCLFPLDLSPSGTAVLHVDRVRRGSRGGLWEETIGPGQVEVGGFPSQVKEMEL